MGTGGAGGQNGLLSILSPLSRQTTPVATEFLGPFVMTGLSLSQQGGTTARTSVYDRNAVRSAACMTVVCACA